MAFAISTPSSSLLHSSSSSSPTGVKILALCSFSNSAVSIPKNAVFQHVKCIPQLGITPFSQWSGLKHMGISISHHSVKMERKGKCKGKGVYASLFGVGAPEFLVIGVVALLVFGPKGLAEEELIGALLDQLRWSPIQSEDNSAGNDNIFVVVMFFFNIPSSVARNLGKTLRAFQPTIRELQEVSREFKSTLEREIGLDDIDSPVSKGSSSNPAKPTSEDTPGDSGTNVEPNGSPSENAEDPDDESLKFAERFRGTLAQIQKEQEEERERGERESSKSGRIGNSFSSNALQEAASVVPTGPAPKTEAEV
ncbi:Sec-independent protein translocase protein TATB, chloroplastic [Sesamum angolense]|uniref:Sec-independent protein translocase protein TATB, chloroplastic n=1 Tax=Sesamum angolense TaxID=2727404 RepID=A0AAE1TD95_9LAMI|nr:Sec-independent protein translocase protein TATB, chloroplastic [Sesamum angolense]